LAYWGLLRQKRKNKQITQPHVNTHYSNTTVSNLVLTLHVSMLLVFKNTCILMMIGVNQNMQRENEIKGIVLDGAWCIYTAG